ncbi:MAG: PKD domain-containing protein, partial [Bacteroidota bacterium]
MKTKLLPLLLALFACGNLFAQVTVYGQLYLGQNEPLGNYPIAVIAENGVDAIEQGQTDADGLFNFSIDTIITEPSVWAVATLDPCLGTLAFEAFEVSPDQLGFGTDLVVCDGINPPPPPDTCVAFFDYVPTDEPLTFRFEMAVADNFAIDSVRWNFGDGNTSTELSPTNTYPENGSYVAQLTVYSGECVAVNFLEVHVFDAGGCDCPAIVAPVCVFNPFGEFITFNNLCEAECAGFDDSHVFDCSDTDCVCPTFEAPICVIADTGDTLTFINHCFAECEGFGPETWFDCVQQPVDTTLNCGCDALPEDPVCVVWFGQVITFRNPCEVECAGFIEPETVDCDNQGGECNCYTLYDPVCAIDASGDTISFQNACFAECEGIGQDQLISCHPETGECDFPPFEVCVIDGSTGVYIAFPGICEALDAGYSLEQLVYCESETCYADFDFLVQDDGFTVSFFNQSFTASGDLEVLWDFADGTTSTELNPTHVYTEAGTYQVTLSIVSDSCTSQAFRTFYIGDQDPVNPFDCQAFFFFEQPDTNNLLTYQFIDFTLGEAEAYLWDFGDGSTSDQPHPFHTFAQPGSYTVTLTIIGSSGCESTIAIGVNAGENIWYGDLECRAWFLPIIFPDSNLVYFANFSSYDAETYFWDFGDGTLSNEYEAQHQYAEPGIYTITLTTTSSNGCENTYSVTIDLHNNNFTSSPPFLLLSSIDEAGNVTPPDVTLFPNPTYDQVSVRWENGTSGPYDWSLQNVAGQVVQRGQGEGFGTSDQFTLQLAREKAGIYLLRLRTPEGIQV